MSYDDFYHAPDDEVYLMTAKDIRRMLEIQNELTLMAIIDHNMENNPKPHHMNIDIMTGLLKREVENGKRN